MLDEEQTPAESESTEDDAGTNVGEEEQGLSSADIDESVAAMMAAKGWMPPERVEETVKARLTSEREQRKAEDERKALESQNEFKQLYEKEQTRASELEPFKAKATRYEEVLNKELEARMENVPEHIKTLLADRDPVDQLTWLSENQEALSTPEQSSFARIPSSGRRSEKKREPGSFVESWQERENKRMGLK